MSLPPPCSGARRVRSPTRSPPARYPRSGRSTQPRRLTCVCPTIRSAPTAGTARTCCVHRDRNGQPGRDFRRRSPLVGHYDSAMTRETSRQAFVRGALGAVAAGALLGSCRPSAPALQIPPTASGPPTTPDVSGPRNWTALADTIDGLLILPSSVDYAGRRISSILVSTNRHPPRSSPSNRPTTYGRQSRSPRTTASRSPRAAAGTPI
jgi:hypothetical protein